MDKKVLIREYTQTDKANLLKIAQEFSNFYVPLNPWGKNPIDPTTSTYYAEKLLKNVAEKDGKIYVAEEDGTLVGFIGAYLTEQSEEEQLEFIDMKTGYISELFVTETLRNQGIGQQLLDKAHNYLKAKGCTHSELEVFAPNKKAHDFYLEHEYKDKNIQMIRSL